MNKVFTTLIGALIGVMIGVVACDPPQAPDSHIAITDVPQQLPEGSRFTIESFGKFNAGYDRNTREILIITDIQTGQQYLGVTGVGVSELRSESAGKTRVTRER